MKFTAQRNVLASALDILVGPAAQAASPIMHSVLLTAHDHNMVQAVTTNTDAYMSTIFPAIVATPGSRALPATKLLAMVNATPSEAISIQQRTSDIKVAGGACMFGLPSHEASEFPAQPTFEPDITLSINQRELITILKSVAACQSTDPTRPVLNSTQLIVEQRSNSAVLIAIATDTRSIARASTTGELLSGVRDDQSAFRYIIPRRTVNELIRVAGTLIDDFMSTVVFGKRHVQITLRSEGPEETTRDVTVISKLIEATYPDVVKYASSSRPRGVTFDGNVLKDTLQRILLVSGSSSPHVMVQLKQGDAATFSSDSDGTGSAKDIVPYSEKATLTADVAVLLNPRMLLAMIKPFTGNTISMNVDDTVGEPQVVYLTAHGRPDFRGYLAPIRKRATSAPALAAV